MELFDVSQASCIGNLHFRAGRGNQDALVFGVNENAITGVICDGSSAYANSQVGSNLAAQIVKQTLVENVQDKAIEDLVEKALIRDLQSLALRMPEFFVFNVVFFTITPDTVCIFRLGDGIVLLNGKGLARSGSRYFDFGGENSFECWRMHTNELQSLIIGSDAAKEFDFKYSWKQANGQVLGRIEELLELDQDAVAEKIQSAQKPVVDGMLRTTIFQDDISVILVNRKFRQEIER